MFKIGDRVRCIEATSTDYGLIKGKEYIVYNTHNDIRLYVHIKVGEGVLDWFLAERFELVEPQFKRGDRVLVWDFDEEDVDESIFIAHIDGAKRPFVCVDCSSEDQFNNGERFGIVAYKHAKPLPAKQTVTLELTDKQLEKIKEIIG